MEIHARPAEREAILKQTIARWKGDDNATMATLAGWLNQQGEYQQELDLVPETRAMQTRELFSLHVEALEKLGRWDDIRRLIESEQFPLDPWWNICTWPNVYRTREKATRPTTTGIARSRKAPAI